MVVIEPRVRRRPLVAVLLLVAGLALGLAAPHAAAQQEGDRVEALEEEVRELRSLLEELRAERAEDAVEAEEAAAAAAREAEQAAGEMAPADDRLDELAHRIDVIAAEVERLALGEEVAPEATTEGLYGLAPSASKVYRSDRGLSIGGYGEMLYQSFDSSRDDGAPSSASDEIDYLRAILYFGYKFNDKWVFNSEIELEHADEAFVEFAYVDYLWRPELNLRGGLLLAPMGWVNELHEPTVFLGARRPDVESVIIPSTWRENGFGLWGESGALSYRAYLMNGLDAAGFSPSGLRGGRQKGSKAKADDFAFVGRLDWAAAPGLVVGGSLYQGGSGQGIVDPLTGRELGVDTSIVELHGEWKYRGFQARLLAARSELDDVAGLNRALGLVGSASVGEELEGWYAELGYDVFAGRGGQSLIPYLRYEEVDTQAAVPDGFVRSRTTDRQSLTLGVAYQPIDQIILKVDYQDYDNDFGSGLDQLNVALGYIF